MKAKFKHYWHNFKVLLGLMKDAKLLDIDALERDNKRHWICKYCKSRAVYHDRFDTYACHFCDLWLESLPPLNTSHWFSVPDKSPRGNPLPKEFNSRLPWKIR
jgi:hypothetical protein